MTVFSHSRIQTFNQCPLRYKYKYIDKIKTEIERSIEAFMGSMVHETLEKLYKDLRFMYVNSLEELINYYNKHWEKNWTDNIVIVRKDYNPENFRKIGEECIKNYYEKYHPFDGMKTVSLEQKVVLDLFDDNRYKLQGFIDRLATDGNGTFEIHDYKTSGNLPSDDKVNEDRQLALYSIAIKKMYPYAKNIFLIWHYLRFGQEIKIEKTEDDLQALKNAIAQNIDEIESAKEFPAKESVLCDWCEFAPLCPRKKHLYETEKLEPKEFERDDGVKLVTKYAELSSKKKHIEDEMKEIENNIYEFSARYNVDNIRGRGVIARVWKGEAFRMPAHDDPERDKLKSILKDAGVWEEYSRLDTFSLSKSIQKGLVNQKLIKKLAPFIKKETIKRIYLKENSN